MSDMQIAHLIKPVSGYAPQTAEKAPQLAPWSPAGLPGNSVSRNAGRSLSD